MTRTNSPVNVFDSRQVGCQKDERKADVEAMSSQCPTHEHCQLDPVVLASDHTMKDTLAEDTDENTKPHTEARVDIIDMPSDSDYEIIFFCCLVKKKKDYKVIYRAADKSETEMKTILSEEMSPLIVDSCSITETKPDTRKMSNASDYKETCESTDNPEISVPDGLSVCTCSSHITGMSGGKAVNSTIIGEDITSRNNTSHIADSVIKLRNETSGSEIVGMEGGESYGSTVIGKKTVSEGNQQTVERSHLDIDGDPSAALQPFLLKAASGHGGDGGGGVNIKDTTIIISGTGGQSEDATKCLEQEIVDTKNRLDKLEERKGATMGLESDDKQTQLENRAGLEQELSNTRRRLQELQDTVGEMKRNQVPVVPVRVPFPALVRAQYGFRYRATTRYPYNAPFRPPVAMPFGTRPPTIVIAPPQVRGRATVEAVQKFLGISQK